MNHSIKNVIKVMLSFTIAGKDVFTEILRKWYGFELCLLPLINCNTFFYAWPSPCLFPSFPKLSQHIFILHFVPSDATIYAPFLLNFVKHATFNTLFISFYFFLILELANKVNKKLKKYRARVVWQFLFSVQLGLKEKFIQTRTFTIKNLVSVASFCSTPYVG